MEQNLHQVVHAREKENAGYRYDAKEKEMGIMKRKNGRKRQEAAKG